MLIYNLMLDNAFLSKEIKEEEETVTLVDNDTWVREIKENYIENLLCIQCVEDKEYKDIAFLYSKGEKGYIYDPIKGALTQCGPIKVRRFLLKTFDISIKEG